MSWEYHVTSPSNVITGEITSEPQSGAIYYSLFHQTTPIILKSPLGLECKLNGKGKKENILIYEEKPEWSEIQHRDTWKPIFGEKSEVPDNYNEYSLEFINQSNLKMKVVFRVFDEGFALRYEILPPTNKKKIKNLKLYKEITQFIFPKESFGYEEHGTEGKYKLSPLNQITKNCERPLLIRLQNGKFVAIMEAVLDDYPRMLLTGHGNNPQCISICLSGTTIIFPGQGIWRPGFLKTMGKTATIRLEDHKTWSSPWRVILAGNKPGELWEHNYLQENLNLSSTLSNLDWIHPGKCIREVTLSTQGGKACIDFAHQHNLSYILYDAGWYGYEHDYREDATTINVDPRRKPKDGSHPGLDLQEVIRYGKEKGIGVFLYVNHRHLEKQLDEILPLYQKWGVAGIKFGFVTVGPQECNSWLMNAVRKCADHNLMVDIHDNYRPTGFSRTYPNLLTQEGVRGNEHMPVASHNCTLPFTRLIMGAADYTICYYDSRIKNTHAHQLAMAIIIYSPLQLVFWYDKPEQYQGEEEIELFERLYTTWDEKKVLWDEIGRKVAIARRKGKEWFVGMICHEEPLDIEIDFSFLGSGNWQLKSFIDNPMLKTRTKVQKMIENISYETKKIYHLQGSGGAALIINLVN